MEAKKTHLYLLLVLLGACNSQDVVLTSLNSDSNKAGEIKNIELAQVSRVSTENIFFSKVLIDPRGRFTRPDGVGFLTTSAKSTQPFSYHFKGDYSANGSRIFFPTPKGVVYAWRSGSNENSISVLNEKTGIARPLLGVLDSTIESITASDDLTTIAWSDNKGRAWLYQKQVADKPLPVKLDDLSAAQVQLITSKNNDKNELLVTGKTAQDQNRFLIFSLNNLNSPEISLEGDCSKESPDQSKIAFVITNDNQSKLFVYDRAENKSQQITTQSGLILELSWKSSHELSYSLVQEDHSSHLHTIEINLGTDSIITTLHLEDQTENSPGIACPIWSDENTVYFSDFQNSQFSIYRAQFDGIEWKRSLFATSSDGRFSYICPQKSFRTLQ